eukprot:1149495-Pelagomonas_calceolata.AAC.1
MRDEKVGASEEVSQSVQQEIQEVGFLALGESAPSPWGKFDVWWQSPQGCCTWAAQTARNHFFVQNLLYECAGIGPVKGED